MHTAPLVRAIAASFIVLAAATSAFAQDSTASAPAPTRPDSGKSAGFVVGRLTAADFKVPAFDPVRQLAGKIPGVRIASAGGRPGADAEILMRGAVLPNAQAMGMAPLIMVDGAIVNFGGFADFATLDLASAEVIKGASGAAVYGTRGARGVIAFTTKRAPRGAEGLWFHARSEYGISELGRHDYGMATQHGIQLDETGTRFCVAPTSTSAGCTQTFDWNTEIMRVNAVWADTARTTVAAQYANPSPLGGQLQNVYQSSMWPGRYYNTLAQMMSRTPVVTNHVDATGNLGDVRVYLSGSVQDEGSGVKLLDGAQHRRGRLNFDYDVRPFLSIAVNGLISHATTDNRDPGFNYITSLRSAPPGTNFLARDSLARPILRGGSTGLRGFGGGELSFLYNADNNVEYNSTSANRFLWSVGAHFTPKDWLTVETLHAFDVGSTTQETRYLQSYRPDPASSSNGALDEDATGDFTASNGFVSATVRRQVRPGLLGTLNIRALHDRTKSSSMTKLDHMFVIKDIYEPGVAVTNYMVSTSEGKTRSKGYLVGGQVDYRDRYILDAAFRRDRASFFNTDYPWANFGRVSGVWRVSEEDFWAVPAVNDFRVRASRGTAGTAPPFLAGPVMPFLRPEETTETELGTDFTLWSRLGVEATFASSKTANRIMLVPFPAGTGFTQQWQNVGALQSRTLELGLNLPVVNTSDVSWSMRGTWDRTRTYVTKMDVPAFYSSGGGFFSGSFFRLQAEEYACRYSAPLPPGEVYDCQPKSGVTMYDLTNGTKANRYGNVWGRKFLKSCSELNLSAPQFSGMTCGGSGSDFQVNDQGWLVWVGGNGTNNFSWKDGITKNLWQTILPGAQSPWGTSVPLYFGMPIVDRPLSGEPGQGTGVQQIIGNVFPDFRFGWSNSVRYKRLSLYGLFEGTIGHEIYNEAEALGLGDWSSSYFDMREKTVETAKPMGYGWRTGPSESIGVGGFYDILGQNSYNTEDGSYVKLREASLSFDVGPVRGFGDWSVALVGRNLLTFTKYSGLDPETGVGGGTTGSGLINQVDTFGFPTLRHFTFALSTRF